MTMSEYKCTLVERIEGERLTPWATVDLVVSKLNCKALRYEVGQALREGSLDAALALKDAVLPGWWFSMVQSPFKERTFCVTVGITDKIAHSSHKTTNPSAAMVAAILRAKHAEEESK